MNFLRLKLLLFFQLIFIVSVTAQYNFDVLFNNAKIAVNQKKYYEAIPKLNRCADIQPKNGEVYFYRGLCKYELSDNFGAEQDFSMAIMFYSPVYYDAFHNRALTRYRLGKFTDAVNDMATVIENNPDMGKLYVERGFFHLANNNYSAALADCKKALALKALGEDGFLCKAQSEEALKDYENALCDYDEVIRINPKNVDAYAYRGMTKFKMENVQDAINDFNLALKIDSISSLAYYCRAEAEIKLENLENAMKDYNKVLQIEPRNSYAYFGRGVLFANKEDYSNAISDFNKVILINPENIEALFNRAKLKQNVKDFKGAIIDYDKITSLFPYFTEAYYYRSQAKYSLKDYAGAKQDMETGKVMSDVFHSKEKVLFNKDSLLLNKLTHLNADFHNTSDIKPDNVNNNFLPIFYFTEKDSLNYNSKNFSLLIDDYNWKQKQNICLKNTGAFDIDSSLTHTLLNSNNKASNQTLLIFAIYQSNLQMYAEAKVIFDSLIAVDSTNIIALFARGVNTCREIEVQNNNNDDYYLIANPNQEKVIDERKEKCKSAISDFSATLRFAPDFYFALYNRAYVKCLSSDYYGANFDYDQAIKKNPAFADAYFNNGFLLYYLNLKLAACESFSKAGELGLQQAFSLIKKHCSGVMN
ncbi:MAG: tetratricopeptide repeat protein [Bacteroidota bacterium]